MELPQLLGDLSRYVWLLKRKGELDCHLVSIQARSFSRGRGHELMLHERDEHGKYYDPSSFREAEAELEAEKARVRSELSEVISRMKELEDRMRDNGWNISD